MVNFPVLHFHENIIPAKFWEFFIFHLDTFESQFIKLVTNQIFQNVARIRFKKNHNQKANINVASLC